MATLYEIRADGSQGERWHINSDPVVVGRSGQAQVSLRDDGVSRRHFLIVWDGGTYVIKDLNSRNGTWVEGRRVSLEKLRHNDCILAGRTQFRFTDAPEASVGAAGERVGPNGTQVLPAGSAMGAAFVA